MQLCMVILMCSSTCMRMVAPGVRRLVNLQLRRVIWMCSSTPMRMDAPVVRGLVKGQLRVVILMCSSTHGRMAAAGLGYARMARCSRVNKKVAEGEPMASG